jgi:hypothetical protein
MIWYQINKTNYDFITHILQRAYIPNDAILFYGNTSNELVYTSLEKELDKHQTITARYDIEQYNRNALSGNDVNSIWYASYDITNYSSYFNRIIGYGAEYTYVNNDTGIEVVGNYHDDKKVTDNINRQKALDGQNVFNSTFGIYNHLNLYSEKYFESFEKNYTVIATHLSCSLVININSLTTVKLCDKVNLMLPSLLDNKISDPYSGLYIIGGITHVVTKGGLYQKMVSLHRNGINKPVGSKLKGLVGS